MKYVAKVDPKSGEIVCRYNSISFAAYLNGCSPSNISHSLKGKHLAAGFIWIEYKPDYLANKTKTRK